jgi:hypothetical protein
MKENEKNAEPKSYPKLEHMKMRWKVTISPDGFTVRIETDEENPWHICLMARSLPGDHVGAIAAKAIVDQHNAALKGKAAKKKG